MNIVQNIGDYLKRYDIKPSYQRIKILEYLSNNKTHPTVDEIYRALHPEIPTLSKTTVYNTLNLFLEKHLIKLLTIEENETRYDIETDVHGHFKCKICGKLCDFPVDMESVLKNSVKDCEISEYHIYFKGICTVCKSKEQ